MTACSHARHASLKAALVQQFRFRNSTLLQVLDVPSDSLLNVHRLDAGTEGVVVLAKSPAFASEFSALMRDKSHCIRKVRIYLWQLYVPCIYSTCLYARL